MLEYRDIMPGLTIVPDWMESANHSGVALRSRKVPREVSIQGAPTQVVRKRR